MTRGFWEPRNPNPVAQLEEFLRVPFVSNLIAQLATEARTERQEVTLWKIIYLCGGLEAANPQVDWRNCLIEGIAATLGVDWRERVDASIQEVRKRVKDDENWCPLSGDPTWWVLLLARSVGIEPTYIDRGSGGWEPALSFKDCRVLHKIWRNQNFTFNELVDELEEQIWRNE